MAWFYLLLNISVVLTCVFFRYQGDALRFACPVAVADARVWVVVIAGFWGAAALVAGFYWRRMLFDSKSRRALAELLLITAIFAYEWLLVSPGRWTLTNWCIISLLLICVGMCFLRDRGNWRKWGVTLDQFIPAARLLIIPTLIMMILPVTIAWFTGTDAEIGRVLKSLGYPVYALVQLMVFQVFLVSRLRHLTNCAWAIVLISGGMFALLHWPNGLLMVSCFVGAMVWTWVYLRRPNVYALAISMGLAAIVLSGALPRRMTQNLRVGPIYVQRSQRHEQNAQRQIFGDAKNRTSEHKSR